MIVVQGLRARAHDRGRAAAAVLDNVTFSWDRGVLAVLGAPRDGTTLLLEILAGMRKVRAGAIAIDGVAPARARRRVAFVPLESALPGSLRVDEVCDLAAVVRDEPKASAQTRLAPLGLEALARRGVWSLSPAESRAVSLALAVSSTANVLLVEEPFVMLEPPASGRVVEALRARAAAGAAVIVTTSSVRDATLLGDQLGLLDRGAFSHLAPALAHVGHDGATLRVVVAATSVTDVSPFVAALAAHEAVMGVETAAFAGARVLHAAVTVVVRGRDLLALARAVAVAATRTRATVEAIESAVMALDGVRPRLAPQARPPQPPAFTAPLGPVNAPVANAPVADVQKPPPEAR